ncbi:MAG: CTP synthase [Lachnospiraceae bacterium]|nr:CTP synthase [Lachnospiraceae bacterium]
MRIKGFFTTGIVEKIIQKMVRKKFGYEINTEINDIDIRVCDETILVHVDAQVEIDKDEFMKILKENGAV